MVTICIPEWHGDFHGFCPGSKCKMLKNSQSSRHKTCCIHFSACLGDHRKVQKNWSRASSRARLVQVLASSPFRRKFVPSLTRRLFRIRDLRRDLNTPWDYKHSKEVHTSPRHAPLLPCGITLICNWRVTRKRKGRIDGRLGLNSFDQSVSSLLDLRTVYLLFPRHATLFLWISPLA